MKPVMIYGFVAAVVVIIISYLMFTHMTRASETYIDASFNLIVVDGNGNMSAVAVRPPSLSGIPPTSNIVYIDSLGNIGVISSGDVYTSYQGKQGKSSNNIRNLLTIDSNNNFGALSTLNFNPCHVNGDPAKDPDSTMNGTPQRDGTCACRNNWSGTTKGDGCAVCDGYGITHTDGSFGALAGPDCQYSRPSNCSSHGNVTGSGGCSCDATYAGSSCQYSNAENCNNRGTVDANGNCPTCFSYTSNADGESKLYLGTKCQFGDDITCGNGAIVDVNGICHYMLQKDDIIRIYTNESPPRYLKGGQFGCEGQYTYSCAFSGGPDANSVFKWTKYNTNIPALQFVGGSYNNQYACAQAWQETSCTARGAFDSSVHGVLTVTSDPRMSIAIQPQGSGLFKIAVDASPVYGIWFTGYGNLADETVCEIFWNQGGTPRHDHKLAGFGGRRTQPEGINLYIEKQGKNGNFYRIDQIKS